MEQLPAPDPTWFLRPDGADGSRHIHGISHTRRVVMHVAEMSAALGVPLELRRAASLAALWHDIGRTHDGVDYFHGAKSAGKVVGLGLHRVVPLPIVEVALFAVTYHPGDDEPARRASRWLAQPDEAWQVFQLLKDADGLDRVRLGDLDPSYLRLPGSAERVDRAWELLRLIP